MLVFSMIQFIDCRKLVFYAISKKKGVVFYATPMTIWPLVPILEVTDSLKTS